MDGDELLRTVAENQAYIDAHGWFIDPMHPAMLLLAFVLVCAVIICIGYRMAERARPGSLWASVVVWMIFILFFGGLFGAAAGFSYWWDCEQAQDAIDAAVRLYEATVGPFPWEALR